MRLQLKEGWTRHISQVPGDKGAVIICAPGATKRSDYAHIVDCIGTPLEESCGVYARANGGPSCTATFQTREDAHKWLLSVGSDSPWQEVPTDAGLTAAAEGEGPAIDADATEVYRERRERLKNIVVDSGPRVRCIWRPSAAPHLCAVDRLEAAGYAVHINDEFRRLHIMRPGSLTVFARNVLNTGRWEAWIDDGPKTASLYARSDESPGLNAALESLLSKPVGAVTVAQILGVSP